MFPRSLAKNNDANLRGYTDVKRMQCLEEAHMLPRFPKSGLDYYLPVHTDSKMLYLT